MLCVFLLGAPFLAYAVLSGNTDPLYSVGRISVKAVLWLAGVRTEVQGREKIPAGLAVVFMPNHQSNWDPPGIFVLLPPVLVMGKKEFFRVPVLGRAMRLRGFIPIDRKNRERAVAAVDEASRALRAGHSFLVFPEGTRNTGEEMQEFKSGLYHLSRKRPDLELMPVYIDNLNRVLPRGEFLPVPLLSSITIGPPIWLEPKENKNTFLKRAREAVRRLKDI